MFILIMEDGEIFKTDIVTNAEQEACEMGIMDMINSETCQQYIDGGWHDLDSLDDESIEG